MTNKRYNRKTGPPGLWRRILAWVRRVSEKIHQQAATEKRPEEAARVTEAMQTKAADYVATYRERAKHIGGESLKLIYGLMKGVTLTAATIVLLQITLKIWPALDVAKPFDPFIALTYAAWLVSFLVLLITYEAPLTGALLIFELPPFWIALFPALFIVFEFLVFAILAPEIFVSDDLTYVGKWQFEDRLGRWFLINGVYHLAISVFCLLGVGYFETASKRLPVTPIASAWSAYREAVKEQSVGSGAVGILSLIPGSIYWWSRPHNGSTAFLFTALILIPLMILAVVLSLKRQYHHRKVVHDIMNPTN